MKWRWNHRHAIMSALVLLVGGSWAQDIAWEKNGSDEVKRIHAAATVLKEVMSVPDQGIPRKILASAKCVAVVPSMATTGFVLGSHVGKGVATCRTSVGWSAPAPLTVSGGEFGVQIGAQAIDIIMLAMNEKGMRDLLTAKFKLGTDASVAAGPVGRRAEAATDWKSRSEILVYSRSRGVFAGLSLEGAVIEQDWEGTRALYGTFVPFIDILTGKASPPTGTQEFVATVREYSDARAGDHSNPPPPRQFFKEPVWNVWPEETEVNSPTFKPVTMQQGRSYLLVIDLAALRYDKYAQEASSQEASSEFDDWLNRQTGDRETVKVLAIPDDRFFETLGDKQVKELTIDLAALRQTKKDGFELSESPFKYLARTHGKAPFSFGEVAFRLNTKENAAGVGSIAFSIWADGKPVDELLYSTCILAKANDPCTRVPAIHDSLRGVDAGSHNNVPDAALHLIELDSKKLVGVFRCNSCGWTGNEFKIWKLGQRASAAWFQEQFVKTVLPGIKRAANGPDPNGDPSFSETTFNNAGEALYGLVFHTEDGHQSDADKAFHDFVADKIAHQQQGVAAPSLFVRLLPQQPDQGFFIPMGLARIKLTPTQKEFLGLHFRIQTPLELQDYSSPSRCLDKWVLLVPPANISNNALVFARAGFAEWITKFQSFKNDAMLYDDLDRFKEEWLDSDQAGRLDNTALLILSHHENNSLYFDPDRSAIFATNVKRHFAIPSLAIIDACGTANPGAFEFIREFNFHGMNAAVASSVDINGRMGGVFLRLLTDALDVNRADQNYSLDRAVFDATKALWDEPDEVEGSQRYGPRALLFGLVGNGKLRLCVPAK